MSRLGGQCARQHAEEVCIDPTVHRLGIGDRLRRGHSDQRFDGVGDVLVGKVGGDSQDKENQFAVIGDPLKPLGAGGLGAGFGEAGLRFSHC